MAKKEKNEEPNFNKPPRAPHSVHADQLMEHAEAMLEEGDRLQASEKAWGAYIHQIKALAEEKGWPYRNTRDLPSIERLIDKLAQEKLGKKEREVINMANTAGSLHTNFYRDVTPISRIRMDMETTKELIDILRQLGGNGNGAPSGNGTPSGSGNDGEEGSSRPPQSSGHRNGTASMGKSHRTPQMSPQMRQAKKLKGQFREEPSVPLLTQNNFPFMTQAEFDALKDF